VIRGILLLVWMAVTVIPYGIFVILLSALVRGKRLYWVAIVWLRMAVWGARVFGGVRHEVRGMENLPAAESLTPVILCPKHQSTWETFAIPTIASHPLAFVFKKELLVIPFFGWALGRLDMIHIDRSKRSEAFNKVAAQGRELMAKGVWIIMFPEGTRIARGEQGVYKTGASRLAIATGASIVPIAITSARCWPRKSFRLIPGTVIVSFGPPVSSEGQAPEQMMQKVEAWIEAEMRRIDPEAYA
jgi:1-acyl-sn-glycerol-3-phosphate acyltransferase